MRLPPPPTHHAIIPINENPRKRKSRSPNQEDEDQETGDSPPQNPIKILRLFGVDIPIYQVDQEAIIPQNPNYDQQEAPAPISPPPPQLNQEEEEEEEAIIPQNPNEETDPAPMDNYPVYHLLFEKELTSSDVAQAHNRLLVTGSQRLMKALTEEERGRVEMNSADGFLGVVARDTNGGKYRLELKKWAGSGAIVLKHEWGKFVCANGLRRGDLVRGWGYRVCGELELLINFVRNH